MMSITARRKLIGIAIGTGIFAGLGALTTQALGRSVIVGVSNATLIGFGVGVFEEFYVQSRAGRWLRSMHPLRAIVVYIAIVIAIYAVARPLSLLALGRL